ncbi:Uncharacterised protein [uncultured archaeon]|nr:Uncharacterised protein [uncultured archaeon]
MKNKKGKLEEALVKQEFHGGIREFLELLEDTEKKNETMKKVSGVLEGPYGSKAEYDCTIRLGLDAGDLPLRRGFIPRPRPAILSRKSKR